MKYIRTKHGTIDEVIGETELHWVVKYIPGIKGALIHKSFVVKQANTIEELCDEFVVVRKDIQTKLIWHRDFNSFMEDINTYKEQYNIYGAIWTEWGLKYVAKLNEKGELELIW